MELRDAFCSLPEEVLSVGDRIGLDQNVCEDIIDTFVKKRLPPNIYNEELRYTSYLLDESFKTSADNKGVKRKKRDKQCLNAKQRKLLFDVSKHDLKYETFSKINSLWHSYVDSVMDEMKSNADHLKLIRCDFHGAYFIVSASINPSLVGIKGYVVQETKNTFRIINEQNRLLTVPKHGTIFAFEHNGILSKLNGYNIKMSSHHRSKIRVKLRNHVNDI